MSYFTKKVASRYLWSKRSEAFITIITIISVIGVAIGVMVLNIVMSVMTGFETELKSRLLGANAHIIVRSISGRIAKWEDIAKSIGTVPGVQSVSPYTYHQALLRVGEHASGLLIRGIEQNTRSANQLGEYMGGVGKEAVLFKRATVATPVHDARGEVEVSLPGIVVGRELAKTLGLYVNSVVSVLSPQVSSSPFGLVPRFRRFAVVGIYSSGLTEYESGLAYVRMEDAQQFFEFGSDVSGIEVNVVDVEKSTEVTKEIMTQIGGLSRGIYPQDWTETNRPLWNAMQLEKRVYFIVLLLIVVMASFSIITTLIMLVLEKRKDIAVLRTMGASAKSVREIFIILGATIGAMGTVLGLALGVVGCLALREYGFPIDQRIFQMSTVPVKMEAINFVLTGLCSFGICCLATIYPAYRASRLEPSEVLRYE